MLVNFSFSNFRSFKNPTEFSMEAGERLRKYNKSHTVKIPTLNKRILKTAVFFGGNANGKTNALMALIYLRTLVTVPLTKNDSKFTNETFGHNDVPASFEIEFTKEGNHFLYKISLTGSQVLEEELTVNDDQIFMRSKDEVSVYPKQLEMVLDNLRPNQLLLYFAQENNVLHAKTAFNWFDQNIVNVSTGGLPREQLSILQNPAVKKKMLQFLRAADFSIIDVEVRTRKRSIRDILGINDDNDDMDAPQIEVFDLYSLHKGQNEADFWLHLREESLGTKAFIVLALALLQNENKEKLILIDEFDRSFHTVLTESLMNLFNDERQTNQFILTTHDLDLMDYNLRQDQIWFAEKNSYGESELYSVFDFDEPSLARSDFGYKKRYLRGLFGGTQIVDRSGLLDSVFEDDIKHSEEA